MRYYNGSYWRKIRHEGQKNENQGRDKNMFTLNLLFVSITVSFKKKEMTYSDYNDQKRIKGLYESMRDKSANHISMF
ncbi:hypothetical protein CGZ90_08930 [Fictibacillus aquaticus]|uniref:YrzI family small protein n=1 Tax=Fictibacillus aquaticus TaxID=2021314 RepID=A0A235FAL2_9BACL|nr:hypothetical protein CGZ90_08930 [Fictibacillus aquaticus]